MTTAFGSVLPQTRHRIERVRNSFDKSLLRLQGRLDHPAVDRFTPWMVAIALFGVLVLLALARDHSVDMGTDLAAFVQGTWLVSEGYKPESTLVGGNLLSEQVALITYPLALVLQYAPRRQTLLFIQSAALALTVVPLWRLARGRGRLRVGATSAVVFAYCVYSALHGVNLAGFHPAAIALPALVAAALFGLEGKFWRYLLAVTVVLACRADLGLAVAALGVLLMVEGRRRWGVWTLLAGMGWVLVAIFFIQPSLSSGAYPYVDAFDKFGQESPSPIAEVTTTSGVGLTVDCHLTGACRVTTDAGDSLYFTDNVRSLPQGVEAGDAKAFVRGEGDAVASFGVDEVGRLTLLQSGDLDTVGSYALSFDEGGSVEFLSPGEVAGSGQQLVNAVEWQHVFQILWGIVSHPGDFLRQVFSEANFRTVVTLLAPVFFLPLVAPRYLLPAVPLYALYLVADVPVGRLSEAPQTVPMTAFIFVATVFALKRSGQVLVERVNVDRRVVVALLLTASVFFVRDSVSSPYQRPWNWSTRSPADLALIEAAALIPPDAPVRASPRVLPLLAERIGLYELETTGVSAREQDYEATVAGADWIIFDPDAAPGWDDLETQIYQSLLGERGFERVGVEVTDDTGTPVFTGVMVFRFTGVSLAQPVG